MCTFLLKMCNNCVKSVYKLCHVCKYFCLEEMCVIYISVVKVRLSRNECHELTITYECNTMLMYECHMNTVVVRVTYKQKVRHFLLYFCLEDFFLHTYFLLLTLLILYVLCIFFSVAKSLCWFVSVEIYFLWIFYKHIIIRGI